MSKIKGLLRNRDFILFLALLLGLFFGKYARWTESITLPALGVVMTLSTMMISGSIFRSPKSMILPSLIGIAMNYAVLSSVILLLNQMIIHDEDIWRGFVILASVPPAVAVIPFTGFLNGNVKFSLIASFGGYLGALIITPLMTIGLLGTSFIDPIKVLTIMVELIILPLVLSRILIWIKADVLINPIKGSITNWGFFIVVYTVVGLNREVFLSNPLSLLPVTAIAIGSTFLLGWIIEIVGYFFHIDPKTVSSLVLVGTLKNYGLAAGLSLSLFSRQTAVPATVSTIFLIVYIIWLGYKNTYKKKKQNSLQPRRI